MLISEPLKEDKVEELEMQMSLGIRKAVGGNVFNFFPLFSIS